jgi:LacI family transcriptional regulator
MGRRLALQDRGLRVPENLSLVGFDDLPASAFMSPTVTVVRQPVYEMGLAIASSILNALGRAVTAWTRYPPLSLMVRQSTRRL